MNNIHPDQPAFPLSTDKGAIAYTSEGYPVSAQGLTLRAYLAAHAMQGLAASRFAGDSEYIARHAVRFADALIEELKK